MTGDRALTKLILYLSIFLPLIVNVNLTRNEGSSQTDTTVFQYIQLQKNTWDKYVDRESSLSLDERVYKILNQHFVFVKSYELQNNYNENDFKVLEKFYEWKNLEPDVKSLHGLFGENFVSLLERQLKDASDETSFNQRALLDFAETVLFDKLSPINGTIEKLQNNIYSQGLFYKANTVREMIFFSSIICNCYRGSTFVCRVLSDLGNESCLFLFIYVFIGSADNDL